MASKNPQYNPFLQFAPTFNWGGRTWGANDSAAFDKYLRRHGTNPDQWRRRHADAAKVFSPADQLLYSYMQPQFRALEAAQRQQQDQYRRQLVDIGGFMNQLMGTLGNVAPAVRDAYLNGANTMGSLGTGYGDVLNAQQAANAGEGNQVLNAIGAPEGQQLQGGDAGGVLAGVAGWLPKEMMNAQGAAWGDWASTLPHSASLEAQIMAKGVMDQMTQAAQDYQGQLQDLITGIPGVRQQLFEQQAKIKQQQFENTMARLKFESDEAYRQYLIAAKKGDQKRADGYLALSRQKAEQAMMQQQGLDMNGDPLPDYYRDKNGYIVPKGYKYNKKGELVSAKGAGGSKNDKPDLGKINVSIANDAQDLVDVKMDDSTYPPQKVRVKWSYERAYDFLWSKYVSSVKNKAWLKKTIEMVLRRQGFKKSGVNSDAATRGNPYP